ncbi:phosphotransferase family protein [Streptomyces sp. NRRL F-5126]|uniref:phosphotransferase family protein n=1 Tax=Streptomyces sp. NRRL F-5126 TaxID=1463857 RepID=UPI0004CC0207|nr:aminoglycoside phosphotransferase family protein [Streptomyces sp. NRRL F-5126]
MTGTACAPAVESACTALVRVAPAAVQRISVGTDTVVYRVRLDDGRRTIVKLFAAGRRHGAAEETRLLHAIAADGRIAVPGVVASGPVPGLGTTAVITTDAGSRTLGDAVRAGQMPQSAALVRLALLMNAFHSIAPPRGVRLAPCLSDQVSALARHCPRAVFAQLTTALEVIAQGVSQDRMVWCHGDLHLENAVLSATPAVTSGRSRLPERLVDFEATTLCVAEYDLAQTLVTCSVLEPADRLFLAAAYGRPVNLQLVTAFTAFQAVRGWTYAAQREGRHRALWAARMRQALSLDVRTERTAP